MRPLTSSHGSGTTPTSACPAHTVSDQLHHIIVALQEPSECEPGDGAAGSGAADLRSRWASRAKATFSNTTKELRSFWGRAASSGHDAGGASTAPLSPTAEMGHLGTACPFKAILRGTCTVARTIEEDGLITRVAAAVEGNSCQDSVRLQSGENITELY